MEKSFAVSGLMLIFAPLKLQCGTKDAAIIGGICCICQTYRTNPIGAAASVIRKDLVA